MSALADAWFDKLDPDKAPGVRQAEFVQRVKTAVIGPRAGRSARPGAGMRRRGAGRGEGGRGAQPGPDTQVGTWPDYNKHDRRLLQVPLRRPADRRQDRRSEEPADGDVQGPAVRLPRRDLHVRHGYLVAREPSHPDQHRLLEDERRGQGEGELPAKRSRLRDVLDPSGRRTGESSIWLSGTKRRRSSSNRSTSSSSRACNTRLAT